MSGDRLVVRSWCGLSPEGCGECDVCALVEIAKAAREQAHEHPGQEWGYDGAGIHVYDGPESAGQGCPQCDALARLDSGATEEDA